MPRSSLSAPPAPPEQDVDTDNPFPDPIVLPLEDVIDLHPFQPHEIRSVVEEYLQAGCAAGFTTVRLIHGKGKGVQRESIRALLARLPYVRAFHDAPPEAGGWGATIVVLDADLANPQRNE
jgi:DNA-nicking Smr family endonuclease